MTGDQTKRRSIGFCVLSSLLFLSLVKVIYKSFTVTNNNDSTFSPKHARQHKTKNGNNVWTMKLNYETCLVGTKSVLVPYRREHVDKYHGWMLDPTMLEATGSEPLSLQEEYDMQISWRVDPDKATFIVLAREAVDSSLIPQDDHARNDEFVNKSLTAMVGDVNLFLSEEEEVDVDSDDEQAKAEAQKAAETTTPQRQAELDIMIAEANCRGKGLGKEVACLMMMYGARNLDIRRFFCKIKEDNTASLGLFRKLGFEQCAYAACFKEIELELKRESTVEMIQTLSELLGIETLQTFECTSTDDDKDEETAK